MADAYVGEIRMFGGDYAPAGWHVCDGQEVPVKGNEALATLLGTAFGPSSKDAFRLPDLRGRVPMGEGTSAEGTTFKVGDNGGEETVKLTVSHLPVHRHRARAQSTGLRSNDPAGNVWGDRGSSKTYAAPPADVAMEPSAVEATGGNAPHDNVMPYLALNFIISGEGPKPTVRSGRTAVEAILGEIRLFPFDAVPAGWVRCDGALLDIKDYQALFSLMGTAFGGDGSRTFGVPDLRGRVPLQLRSHAELGSTGGSETHVLSPQEMSSHTHVVKAAASASTPPKASPFPRQKVWGPLTGSSPRPFGANPDVFMHSEAITEAGGGRPHNNLQPYVTVVFCLNVSGIFPRRP